MARRRPTLKEIEKLMKGRGLKAKKPTRKKIAPKKPKPTFPATSKATLTITHEWVSFNEIINKTKRGWKNYYYFQKKTTDMATLIASRLKVTVKPPVKITFNWHLRRNLDPDNITFNQKFIIDGLVHAGVLGNDTPKYVQGPLTHNFTYKTPKTYVEVIIESV